MQPGLHFSTLQRGVMTLDLRFKRPNAGDYVSPAALHSIEHMLATALRNGPQKEHILYFGPMGCRTGFYLLTEGLTYREAYEALRAASLPARIWAPCRAPAAANAAITWNTTLPEPRRNAPPISHCSMG